MYIVPYLALMWPYVPWKVCDLQGVPSQVLGGSITSVRLPHIICKGPLRDWLRGCSWKIERLQGLQLNWKYPLRCKGFDKIINKEVTLQFVRQSVSLIRINSVLSGFILSLLLDIYVFASWRQLLSLVVVFIMAENLFRATLRRDSNHSLWRMHECSPCLRHVRKIHIHYYSSF